jgi:hypothetical protein
MANFVFTVGILRTNMIVHHIANPIPRHCSSVDAVDVGCSELRILSKQVVNGLHDFCKTSGGILKLEQFFDAEELTTFEDRFFSFLLLKDAYEPSPCPLGNLSREPENKKIKEKWDKKYNVSLFFVNSQCNHQN